MRASLKYVCTFALCIAVPASLFVVDGLAGGTQPATPPTPSTSQQQEAEQLKARAAERLSRLADYLEDQATLASREANTIRGLVTTDQPSAALTRSLDSAGSRVRSVIAKEASKKSLSPSRNLASEPKVVGGEFVSAIDEKANAYRDYADHLKGLSDSIKSDTPQQALTKIDQAYVPPDVQQVLKPETTDEPPRAHARTARALVPDTNGSEPTPLEVFATGSGRVVGTGAWASIDFPSVVALLQDRSSYATPQFSPWCSGTLIAPNAVLTAAHCFCSYSSTQEYTKGAACKSGKFHLLNGETRDATDPSFRRIFFQHGGQREIERIEINPNFSFPFADLAVAILKEPVPYVSPIAINATGLVPVGTVGTIVGFGRHSLLNQLGAPITEYAGNDVGLKFVAKTLTGACPAQDANLDLICWHYSSATLPQSVRRTGNTCNGDSGGPLFAEIDGKMALVGVTSGGKPGDCGPGDDAFDVEVFTFKDWIEGVLAANPPSASNNDYPALDPLEPNTGRYYFAKATWQFHPQSTLYRWPLTVPNSVRYVRISVNTNHVMQAPLQLRLVNANGDVILDENGQPACDIQTEDSVASCEVQNHATSPWRIAASGPGLQWFQIVATGF